MAKNYPNAAIEYLIGVSDKKQWSQNNCFYNRLSTFFIFMLFVKIYYFY